MTEQIKLPSLTVSCFPFLTVSVPEVFQLPNIVVEPQYHTAFCSLPPLHMEWERELERKQKLLENGNKYVLITLYIYSQCKCMLLVDRYLASNVKRHHTLTNAPTTPEQQLPLANTLHLYALPHDAIVSEITPCPIQASCLCSALFLLSCHKSNGSSLLSDLAWFWLCFYCSVIARTCTHLFFCWKTVKLVVLVIGLRKAD